MFKSSIVILFIVFFFTACGGDDRNPSTGVIYDQTIYGEWQSTCYELNDDDTNAITAYVIDYYYFNDNLTHRLESTYYEDHQCDQISEMKNYFGEYTIGEKVDTEDGGEATRISLLQYEDNLDSPTSNNPIIPDKNIELVYRITSKIELNFGDYDSDETPELNYDITYFKQE